MTLRTLFQVLLLKSENMLSSSLKFFLTNLSVRFHFGKKIIKFFYGDHHEFFLIRTVSNAPKSFHFRLCLFFSQQSFRFFSLQHQRIQSCEADTIPKPAKCDVQMFLLRTHFWCRTWYLHIRWREKQSALLYWMRPDVPRPHGLLGWKLRIFHRKLSFYSIWHWGFLRNNKLNSKNYAV